jgi:hypothetical protein
MTRWKPRYWRSRPGHPFDGALPKAFGCLDNPFRWYRRQRSGAITAPGRTPTKEPVIEPRNTGAALPPVFLRR